MYMAFVIRFKFHTVLNSTQSNDQKFMTKYLDINTYVLVFN